MDWRLLAAMAYQESHWNPNARSHTGVRGMMMLTGATASELGVEDRTDPLQSLRGGARFFKNLLRRLPSDIEEPDRTFLALAAYNHRHGPFGGCSHHNSAGGRRPPPVARCAGASAQTAKPQSFSYDEIRFCSGRTSGVLCRQHPPLRGITILPEPARESHLAADSG